jgi:hypothetical protein
MFPTCSRPHVVGEHRSRISRSRAKFVRMSDGIRTRDRRDQKNTRGSRLEPRRLGPWITRNGCDQDATTTLRRAGASVTTAAPSERADCIYLRRESARHCEARKADDGSRTRDLRLGNQRLDPPPQRGRHPPPVVVRYQARSPSPPGPQRGARSRLATAWSPCHPRRGCGCHRPVAATPLGHTRRWLFDWGSDRPDFPSQSG